MLCLIGATTLLIMVAYLLTKFIGFHIDLVLENKTTIEGIAHDNEPFDSPYFTSKSDNIAQVFGSSKILMFFPVSIGPGKPVGDGINWNTTPDLDEPKY